MDNKGKQENVVVAKPRGKKRDINWDVVTMHKRKLQYKAYATEATPVGKYFGVDGGKPALLSRQFIVEMVFESEQHLKEVCEAVNKRLDAGEKLSVSSAVRAEARARWPQIYGGPIKTTKKAQAVSALRQLASTNDAAARAAALKALAEALGVDLGE